MKHMRVIPVSGILILTVFFLKAKGEDSTVITKNAREGPTEANNPETTVSEVEIVLKKWRIVEKIFQDSASEAVRRLFPSITRMFGSINISHPCSNSLMKMIYGIKQMKLWAFAMIDASGKIPNGLLNGYPNSLGDYDGCLAIEVPGSTPFRGQYCSVVIKPPLLKKKPFHKGTDTLTEFVNFTKEGTVFAEATRNAHYFIVASPRTSICVPSTCSRDDVAVIIDTLTESVGFPWNVSVPTCDVTEPMVFSKSDKIIICILGVIAFMVLAGTVVDIYLHIFHKEGRNEMEASSTTIKCMMCFSAYSNTLQLLKPDNSADSIKIFHGMKVITIKWVVLGHLYIFLPFQVMGGVKSLETFPKHFASQAIFSSILNVETFFFISAVLQAYNRMKSSVNHINIPMYIFHRLWRLTPTFMFVTAASILLPHIGSGPAWKEVVGLLADQCKENWWTNLVYITNFVPTEKMCLGWFWYLAADTHLYLLAMIVVVPLKSHPKLALGINGLFFLAGTTVTAVMHVYYNLPPTSLYIYPDLRDIHYIVERQHVPTYIHIPAYCTGLLIGYILATVPKLKIPKVLNIGGWIISITLGLLVIYGAYDWHQGNLPGMAVSTLYACTSKTVWCLALSYVIIACFTGNGGIITTMLSWSVYAPLARLTFCLYLVHPIVNNVYLASSRTLRHLDHKTQTFAFLGIVVMSYMVAYAVFLMCESPCMGLEKFMRGRGKFSKASERKLEIVTEDGVKSFDKREISVVSMNKIENEMQ